MLGRLQGPDQAAQMYPIETWTEFSARYAEYRRIRKTDEAPKTRAKKLREIRRDARIDEVRWLGDTLLRRVTTRDGFRERLTAFWADHFTVVGKGAVFRSGMAPYIEEAIRPNVGGRFADMLRAVATAPMMLRYLDQEGSFGPNSRAGQRRGRGANENLAREMLELHTVGVGAGYDQTDVIELAHLLTGLSITSEGGFVYRDNRAEPGAETVLGVSYGSDGPARLEDIEAALVDLARHPDTATHIARKLAVHFIADTPDPALVDAMARAYRDSDGALPTVYAAMLDHPAAWEGAGTVKPPLDFVASSLRAIDARDLPMRQRGKMSMLLREPIALMGQPWSGPEGPDGWPEDDADWITPQRLAGRLQWALNVPGVLVDRLPDPRELVEAVLARPVPDALRFAAGAAATREEGVALILSSPAFQRT